MRSIFDVLNARRTASEATQQPATKSGTSPTVPTDAPANLPANTPQRLSAELQQIAPALDVLSAPHKAFFLTVLFALHDSGQLHGPRAALHRGAPHSLLVAGAAAVAGIPTLQGFSPEQRSTIALAALLHEFGCLDTASPELSVADLMAREDCWHDRGREPYAHPYTLNVLQPHLDAHLKVDAELVRVLRVLLGSEPHLPYRMASQGGPLGRTPVDAWTAHMREAVMSAVGQAWTSGNSRAGAEIPMPTLTPTPTPKMPEPKGSGPSLDPSHAASILERLDQIKAGMDLRSECSVGKSLLDCFYIDRAAAERTSSINAPAPNLHWAAGLLDGDGCISIVRQRYPHRADNLRLTVSISQNCRQTLEHFQACVGVAGRLHAVKRQVGHNKQVYVLNYSGPGAQALIEQLQGCLYRKRHEAAVALAFCRVGQVSRRFGPGGVPPHLQRVRESFYNKLKALK